MSYDIGTHVSFKKKDTTQTTARFFEVGTQFIFSLTPKGFKAARRIPILVA